MYSWNTSIADSWQSRFQDVAIEQSHIVDPILSVGEGQRNDQMEFVIDLSHARRAPGFHDAAQFHANANCWIYCLPDIQLHSNAGRRARVCLSIARV